MRAMSAHKVKYNPLHYYFIILFIPIASKTDTLIHALILRTLISTYDAIINIYIHAMLRYVHFISKQIPPHSCSSIMACRRQ